MNTRRKGNAARRRVINSLEELGYLVDVVEKTGRFIKQKDLFCLFDLIAIKSPGEVLLVQVTSNKPHNHEKLQAFKESYPLVQVAQWVWSDRKGHDVYTYFANHKKEKVRLW